MWWGRTENEGSVTAADRIDSLSYDNQQLNYQIAALKEKIYNLEFELQHPGYEKLANEVFNGWSKEKDLEEETGMKIEELKELQER